MRLTKRQHQFVWAAAKPGGLDPWDYERPLRNEELEPVVAAGLVEAVEQADEHGDITWWWATTDAGRTALSGGSDER